jgi:hypothetical protein
MARRRFRFCEWCAVPIEDGERDPYKCFRCWFMLDQITFRDQSWQVGQTPLPFSTTRFASSPDHTRAERRKPRALKPSVCGGWASTHEPAQSKARIAPREEQAESPQFEIQFPARAA